MSNIATEWKEEGKNNGYEEHYEEELQNLDLLN